MLKVTLVESRAERRLVVEGKLVSPWVEELQAAWNRARQDDEECAVLVDLSGATVIDSSGKSALTRMIGEGARVVAKGVYNEHLVKGLIEQARPAEAMVRQRDGTGMRSNSAKHTRIRPAK